MGAVVDPETGLRFCTTCRAVYRADFARCPKVFGVSCCEVKAEEQLATLTWADADRLREVTGRPLSKVLATTD